MVLRLRPGVVTSVWIGFDDHRRDLGRTTASGAIKDQISGYEGGAKSVQPARDAVMKSVLRACPEQPLTPPPGVVTVNIDRSTGQLANGGNSRAEYFIPRARSQPHAGGARGGDRDY